MSELLNAPEDGITVRMYRQGHGDCFLLAMPRKGGGDPVHLLIDCGYKPGSQKTLPANNIGQIVKHIETATNKSLDVVVVTHEHQDHVNGFWKKTKPYFKDITIDEAWLAWTESPSDALAKKLRKKHRDQLLQLVEARNQMAGFAAKGDDDEAVKNLDEFLALEFGGEDYQFNLKGMRSMLGATDIRKSTNKQAMKLIMDKADQNRGVSYLNPGDSLMIPGTEVRAYIFGPPRSEDLLKDEDPKGDEEFHFQREFAGQFSFGAALNAGKGNAASPFRKSYADTSGRALQQTFFKDHYGKAGDGNDRRDQIESPGNAGWRRIDHDWMRSAENLALKLNTGINNTSLVIAFELPRSGRVLLFVGDAQRGNWLSWDDQDFTVEGEKVTAKDLMGRTVLYKVGHHCSHNATLDGDPDSDYPNLSWMGKGSFGEEFTAMITAVEKWALTKNNPPWRHPLPAIRKALEAKSQGRIFQTDIDMPEKPEGVSETIWTAFLNSSDFEKLYFDFTVRDQ